MYLSYIYIHIYCIYVVPIYIYVCAVSQLLPHSSRSRGNFLLCLPDLRPWNWASMQKGKPNHPPTPTTTATTASIITRRRRSSSNSNSNNNIKNDLATSTLLLLTHKNFYVFNLEFCYCFYQSRV